MIAPIRLSDEMFDSLGQGNGGSSALRVLRTATVSRRLLTLRSLLREAKPDGPGLTGALEVIIEAQRREPAVAAELFGLPWVGSWLARCARRLRGLAEPSPPLWADLAHLGSIAVAAAIRIGIDADLTACMRNGTLMLPGMGVGVLPIDGIVPARIRVSAGTV